MNINFEYYKVFYYVAKYKKISLAAEKLFVSQPAVTQTIQKLEDQMGETLFYRNKNGIELTDAGRILYQLVSESIELLDTVEYRFGKYENLEEGEIKIRTGSNIAKILLYDALEKFCKDYPNIKIKVATGAPNESVKMLHTGEIDMVLVYLPYKEEYPNLKTTECSKQEYVFAMTKEFFEKNNVKIKKIEDLNNYPLILPKKNSAIGTIFASTFKDRIYNCKFEIAQEQMKKEFILRNMGIGFIIKEQIKEELKTGKIIEVDLKDSKVCGAIGAITLNDKSANAATKKLLEYMKKQNNL